MSATQTDSNEPKQGHVAVDGGELAVFEWGSSSAPLILALHGVTSSHMAFAPLARILGQSVRLVAPDLRGRGRSNRLPPDGGLRRHADDCAAVLRAYAKGPTFVVGHSMGGFVTAVLATRHPELVSRILFVDGGMPLPLPPGVSPEAALNATLGVAAKRLSMTFPNLEAHRELWRKHPAFIPWTEDLERYVDADLEGEAPHLKSRVSIQAVSNDSADVLGPLLTEAWSQLQKPAVLLRAERGLANETPPLYPEDRAVEISRRMPLKTIDANHYSIMLGDAAHEVASYIRPYI